ncbi:MAG: hypothetical protein NVSMB44_34330 [Ktedonobacteraceae bacterium]
MAPLTVFYAYAREDEELREKLEMHLSLLRREELIAPWSDRMITAGRDWAHEIDKRLNVASVILLLISPAFIASDYCYGVEMTRALERHRRAEARVIPVLLRPCDWRSAPFAHLAVLPTNASPVTLWSNEDEAFLNIAEGIRRVIVEMHTQLADHISSESRTEDAEQSTGSIRSIRSARSAERRLRSGEPGNLLVRYDAHADKVITVAWSPNGRKIASGGLDSTVHIWQVVNSQHLLTYRGHSRIFPPAAVYAARWSPNGTRIASAGISATVQVWDPTNGQKVAAYAGHSAALPAIFHLEWSPDGRRIASTNMALSYLDEAVHIWDASSGRRLLRIDLRRSVLKSSSPGDVTWSPDGQLLAVSWEKKVRIYNTITGKHILTYEDHPDWISEVAWSPDGKYIVSSSARRINIWEPLTCTTLFTYIAHEGSIRDVAWSPDSTLIASAGEDRTVQIWEASTGRRQLTYNGHTDCVTAVSWSPDSTRIASSSNDRTIHIWQVL